MKLTAKEALKNIDNAFREMDEFNSNVSRWVSVKDKLPEIGQNCMIIIKTSKQEQKVHGQEHKRLIDYVFTDHTGVTVGDIFQKKECKANNLYELAYDVKENIVTHWFPIPYNYSPFTDDKFYNF